MPHILIVDSDTAELNANLVAARGMTTGQNYAAALGACDAEVRSTVIAPYEGDVVPDLAGFDGVVFTGSGVSWNTHDARAAPLADVMRKVFDAGLPTLGSCNGMQLAASVLGGRSEASPKGREDGLARDVHLTQAGRAHPFLAGRTDGFAVPCVHRDEVSQLPEGAVLLASNAHSEVQAFAYEHQGIRFWGVQYHPEYDPVHFGPELLRWERFGPEEAGDIAAAPQDPDAAARLGIRAEDLWPEVRMTELRNWLASL